MLHVVLGLLLLALVVGGAVSVLSRVVSAAFPHGGSSSRSSGGRSGKALRSPAPRAVKTAGRSAIAAAAHPTNRQIRAQAKADTGRAWTEVKATDWLEQRRHDRQNGTPGTGGSTTTATKPTLSQRLRLRPFTPADAAGTNGNGTNGSTNGNGNGTSGIAPVPVNGTKNSGSPPKATTSAPASTNGGTMGTSTASAEKLIEGINEIYAHAATGGINAKQEAIKAAHEACVRFASMAQMLARTMSEPDHNYGPEITEPCAKAGQHLQAAAMSWAEADAAITTLKNMTVGDLAKSPRQAPHHRELSENGSR